MEWANKQKLEYSKKWKLQVSQRKDNNEDKKKLPFSQFLLNYENYWKFALLCLIMKHCKRAKHGNNLSKWGANYKIGKTCWKRQFSNYLV